MSEPVCFISLPQPVNASSPKSAGLSCWAWEAAFQGSRAPEPARLSWKAEAGHPGLLDLGAGRPELASVYAMVPGAGCPASPPTCRAPSSMEDKGEGGRGECRKPEPKWHRFPAFPTSPPSGVLAIVIVNF